MVTIIQYSPKVSGGWKFFGYGKGDNFYYLDISTAQDRVAHGLKPMIRRVAHFQFTKPGPFVASWANRLTIHRLSSINFTTSTRRATSGF